MGEQRPLPQPDGSQSRAQYRLAQAAWEWEQYAAALEQQGGQPQRWRQESAPQQVAQLDSLSAWQRPAADAPGVPP